MPGLWMRESFSAGSARGELPAFVHGAAVETLYTQATKFSLIIEVYFLVSRKH
jgi:hypothetical protein